MEIRFTDREIDVMQVLWDQGPSVVGEVRAALKDSLAYTTVLTILRTLEDKRYVGRDEEGKAHRYFANVSRQAAQGSALRHVTEKLFNGSAELLLTRLLSDQNLNPELLRHMHKLPARRQYQGER